MNVGGVKGVQSALHARPFFLAGRQPVEPLLGEPVVRIELKDRHVFPVAPNRPRRLRALRSAPPARRRRPLKMRMLPSGASA
jgi:hypothetical protein